MRLAIFVFIVIAIQLFHDPVAVQAATTSDCATSTDTFADDLATNTTRVDDLASPYNPSPDHVAQSAARYNREAVYFAGLCPNSKKIYADALLATWKAWLEHATTHVDPIDTRKLAAEKLEKCSRTYAGTTDGATCATWEKQMAKWERAWGDH
jgi:hypothetical protein